MSNDGFIIENMDLPHIHLAVWIKFTVASNIMYFQIARCSFLRIFLNHFLILDLFDIFSGGYLAQTYKDLLECIKRPSLLLTQAIRVFLV
jgi:hypothetical protein